MAWSACPWVTRLVGPNNQVIPARVVEVTPAQIKVDANHEFAGKPLNFEIELLEVEK